MRWNGSQLRSGVLLLGIWLEGLEWYSESCGGVIAHTQKATDHSKRLHMCTIEGENAHSRPM